MIRAKAKDPDTVYVSISSHDYRVVQKEKNELKGTIPAIDRYWNGKHWVILNAQKYTHLWYVDHALRVIMKQLPLIA